MTLQERTVGAALASSLNVKHCYLVIFALVTFAVYIFPPPSVFISFLPDILRPESVFLIVFLAVRLICSKKIVKFSLEFSFLLAICFMSISISWAVAGLGIHIVIQDFVDIYSFLVYWAVFRYGYELTVRYHYTFTSTLTIVFFLIIVIQFAFVLGQRMDIGVIMNISSWWSQDYDAVPWLRITRPHGMTANAITLSILMVLYFLYFLGQALSQWNSRSIIVLSQMGLVLSVVIVVLTKSRTGFVLFFVSLFIFVLISGRSVRKIVVSLLKGMCVMLVVIVVMFAAARGTGYQGKFVLVSATMELMDRLKSSVQEGMEEKEGAVGRIADARKAFSQLSESPYVGIGPAHSVGKSWFHSSYITLLRRYGVIGLFVYLTPYLFILLQAARYIRSYSKGLGVFSIVLTCSALCILIGGITNYTFIGEWQINYFFWLLAGIIVAKQRVHKETVDSV